MLPRYFMYITFKNPVKMTKSVKGYGNACILSQEIRNLIHPMGVLYV